MIGILTLSRAYNYGAALQTFAIQRLIESMGFECEIIDSRLIDQEAIHMSVSIHNSFKRNLKNIILNRLNRGMRIRKDRFDKFFLDIKMSSRAYYSKEQLSECANTYDIFVVGSDQIWNPTKVDFSSCYFLDFVDNEKHKVAYAPSIGNASKDDLIIYKDLMNEFRDISCREVRGADVLRDILGRDIPVVLDPTLLLSQDDYKKFLNGKRKNSDKYILYYTLDGFDKRKNNVEILIAISKKLNLKVKVISPEWPKLFYGFENIFDAGPCEFLDLIHNAELICTNSFHATALSIVFNKPFYVLEEYDGKDDRKASLLKLLEISDRNLYCTQQVETIDNYRIDYNKINMMLNARQKDSRDYLVNSLNIM